MGTGNTGETPVFSDMPSNVMLNEKNAKSLFIHNTGNEKSRVTVTLAVFVDGTKISLTLLSGEKQGQNSSYPLVHILVL